MMWNGYEGWGFGLLHMLGFWVLLIVAVMLIVRWLGGVPGRSESGHEARETALDILKKRYAKGEIDKEEFESKKRDLAD